jgi:hypothetical protein
MQLKTTSDLGSFLPASTVFVFMRPDSKSRRSNVGISSVLICFRASFLLCLVLQVVGPQVRKVTDGQASLPLVDWRFSDFISTPSKGIALTAYVDPLAAVEQIQQNQGL